MTAKEKAKELIEKMWLHSYAQDGAWMDRDMAKNCALIAVEQILENGFDFTDESEYWQEVKKEIEKL